MGSGPRSTSLAVVVCLLFAPLVVLSGCAGGDDDGAEPIDDATGHTATLRGVALTPRSFGEADVATFLDLADRAGDVLMHAGDWADLATAGNAFEVVEVIGPEHGMVPLVVVSASSAGQLLAPLDAGTVDARLGDLAAFVTAHEPPWLGIGNEVNMLADENPGGYAEWLEVWERAVDIVATASPGTTVFPVLQYEWLLGRRGGLFGGTPGEPRWELLDGFDGADAIGFTSYPGLVVDSPDELPPDYYEQISLHSDLPVVFTEIGWQSDPGLALNPGSEAEQADFVDRFFDLTRTLRPVITIWPFVHAESVEAEAFSSMGLRRPDGSARPAWDRWLAAPR
ncbi:MAG: hypothetical protein RIE08_03810 [Acidimicrobiales bacterium]